MASELLFAPCAPNASLSVFTAGIVNALEEMGMGVQEYTLREIN